MDSGIPHSLLTPQGEIVFNDLSGDASATAELLAGDLMVLPRLVWPGPGVVSAAFDQSMHDNGLPPGNGYLMQFVGGTHGAPIRATIDNRPHKHGGIVHKFFSGPKYFTLTGLIVADTPKIRTVLYDYLAGWLHSAMQVDARHFFNPVGRPTRFHTVRCYDLGDIVGPTGSPGASPSGIAAPKAYDVEFVAVNPFSYTYTERDEHTTGSVFVPNDGTVETWPVIEVNAGSGGTLESFGLDNGVFTLTWTGSVPANHLIEVNMFNETLYQDRNGANKLAGMTDNSDFWSIPPGGATITCTGVFDSIDVKSNDAWV